ELAVRLVYFARDFRDQFVRTNSSRRGQFRFTKDRSADHLCEWPRCAGMLTDVEIRFVERERFNQRREPVKNSTDHGGFAAIDIEPCWQHDEVWTALQRHKSGHSRAHTELARLVIACCQNSASVSCAAHANWLAAQRGTVANLD